MFSVVLYLGNISFLFWFLYNEWHSSKIGAHFFEVISINSYLKRNLGVYEFFGGEGSDIHFVTSIFVSVFCLMNHVQWKLVFPAPAGPKGPHILQFLRCYNVTHNMCHCVPSNIMDNTELHTQLRLSCKYLLMMIEIM